MPMALIIVGALLVVLTFLLAFTIHAEMSAVVGVACIVLGSIWLGRRSEGRRATRSHRN